MVVKAFLSSYRSLTALRSLLAPLSFSLAPLCGILPSFVKFFPPGILKIHPSSCRADRRSWMREHWGAQDLNYTELILGKKQVFSMESYGGPFATEKKIEEKQRTSGGRGIAEHPRGV